MENKEKVYIVSFGDSAKFRVPFNGSKEELENSEELTALSKELYDYLKKKAGEAADVIPYVTPVVTKTYPSDAEKYAGYPELSSASIQDLKATLLNEVQDMMSNSELNREDPYATADSLK